MILTIMKEIAIASLVVADTHTISTMMMTNGFKLMSDEDGHKRFDNGGSTIIIGFKDNSPVHANVFAMGEEFTIKSDSKIVKTLKKDFARKSTPETGPESLPTHKGLHRVLVVSANEHIPNAHMVAVRYDKDYLTVGSPSNMDLGLATPGVGIIVQIA